jgi:hypothetical protein
MFTESDPVVILKENDAQMLDAGGVLAATSP